MTSTKHLHGGETGRESDQHSTDGSTQTVYQSNRHEYEIHGDAFGEPTANAVDIDGIIYIQKPNMMEYFTNNILIAAKDEYVDLKRELSRISRLSTHASKLEEGAAVSDEFNLDEYLHDLRKDEDNNGHELKNLGLIWKNLTVQVHIHI